MLRHGWFIKLELNIHQIDTTAVAAYDDSDGDDDDGDQLTSAVRKKQGSLLMRRWWCNICVLCFASSCNNSLVSQG